ncbi:MAG TPA: hypothetical protein VL360_02575 [Gammaproteobacteria bacterium]|jgi:hypothetical protein|nr:hypothetical protein [Gammaproteobacteria bacterium]
MTKRNRNGFSEIDKLKRSNVTALFKDVHDNYLVKKKPPEDVLQHGDIQKKYQNLWYLKKHGNDFKTAALEVIAQELFRLLLSTHPKARLVDTGDDQSYVTSRQVDGFKDIHLFDFVSLKDSIAAGEYKGLGEILVISIWLDEIDLKPDTLGLDGQGNFIKIDGERCFAALQKLKGTRDEYDLSQISFSQLPYLSGKFAYNWLDLIIYGRINDKEAAIVNDELLNNSSFRREVNRALMKIIVLPDDLLLKFVYSYFPGVNRLANEIIQELSLRRDDVLKSAIKSESFCKYLQSDDAKNDLSEHMEYIKSFTTIKKTPVIAAHSTILKDINDRFDNVCKRAKEMPVKVSEKIRKKMAAEINEYIQSMELYKTNEDKTLNWSLSKSQNARHAYWRVIAMEQLMDLITQKGGLGFDECLRELAKIELTDQRMQQGETYGGKFFEAGKFARTINAVQTMMEADRKYQLDVAHTHEQMKAASLRLKTAGG